MKRLIWGTSVFALMSLAVAPVYAVVPPSTVLESPQTGMSPLDWFMYGSIVIVLCGLLAAAVALIAWLVRALFKH